MKKNLEVIQEENSDCGICCLASIIKYYNGFVPLEILRYNTNTDAFGTNAYELINCAKKYGFNSYGESVKDIIEVKYPIIAHLKMENNLYHFVVVYKIKNNNLLIMDPAIGFRKMNIVEFNKLFTGVIIHFFQVNPLPKYKNNKFIKEKIIKEINKNKQTFIVLIIINLLILIFSVLINFQIELLNINHKFIYYFLGIILLNEILIYIKNNLLINRSIRFNSVIIKKFIIHIFNLPSNYLKLKTGGEIVTRFNELNELSINILNIIINILFNIVLSIVLFIIILLKTPKLLFIIFIFTVIYLVNNINIYNKLVKEIKQSINLEEDYNASIIDYISKINTIKNINNYDYFINNINSNLFNKNNINKSINKKIYKITFFNNLFLNVIMLLLLYNIIINKYGLTDSLLIYILFNYYINTIKNIIEYYPSIILYKSIIKKNGDFLSFKQDKLKPISNKFNFINLKNITYSINGNIILNKINLNIINKDKIFINGPSGIGKSTLMKILSKEIINYKGIILKDNIDIKEYDVSNLITYVSQNDSLFNDTIENNILLGDNIEKEKLDKVLEICRINNINIIKEVGLNSLILNDTSISGGERNRIILARSLIHSKNILILDEVLKEVDYKLEKDIIKDVIKEFKDKTIIYISHKNVGYLFNKVLTLGKE